MTAARRAQFATCPRLCGVRLRTKSPITPATPRRWLSWGSSAERCGRDKNGRLSVFAPRTLTRAYVDGRVQPANITEPYDTGKTSLLLRNEEAAYDKFDVEARTLDYLLRDRLAEARSTASFFG